MNKKNSTVTTISLIIVGAVLYGVGCFATMNIAIGTVTFRPAAFIACAWGILFGPWIGGISAAIGNTFISDVLSGWFGIGGVGGFLGNFIMGFLPALMVRNAKKWAPISIWSGIAAVICAIFIAGWQQIMSINKFWPMFIAVCASNIPINLILTPIAVKLLLPRVQKRGLYWKDDDVDDEELEGTL
ncbi:MAG: ECF transporter S component [Candidatus Pelethousia sp.]|nr:ECF transporter S component [Candidatus Pelethousia sp.]